ncbi:MAG: cardiolipin synthase ClsB [Methylophilaceae bacterium]
MNSSKLHLSTGNQVILLRNGAEYFPALEAAIDNAQHEIYLQTYIFEADKIGLRISAALKRAAIRGVTTCVLLDGFGCKNIPPKFVQEMQEAGVSLLFYRQKISPWTFKRNRLRRLHSKLTVIDGSIGFVGGINIIDDFNTPHQHAPRIDYAVSVRGPLLKLMHASAYKLWQHISWLHFRQPHISKSRGRIHPKPAGSMRAAFVIRDNVLHRNDIEEAYLEAIINAQTEIVIANSYFLPGLRFRRALIEAQQRGVRVILLLQARVEYRLLDYASHALYSAFLRQGIEIYEYHKSFMHSKVAVIDHHWVTVGSSNIDPFSLLLAREANVIICDDQFGAELRADIECTITKGSRKIRPERWKRERIIKRFFYWLVYGLLRFVLGILGYPDKR